MGSAARQFSGDYNNGTTVSYPKGAEHYDDGRVENSLSK